MENIQATPTTANATRRIGGYAPTTLAAFAAVLGAGLWGSWATTTLLELERREVVTVELAGMMGAFVEAEARSGNTPDVMKARVERYLKAVDASVAGLGREGRTVLVAEAVVSGSAPDVTERVRADVARRLEGKSDGKH